MDALDIALRIVSPIIALGSMAISVLLYRASARRKELDALGTRIDTVADDLDAHKEAGQESRAELRERLGHVEERLSQMPGKDDVHKLALDVADIRGAINTQGETLKAVAATSSRVEEYLLRQAGVKA